MPRPRPPARLYPYSVRLTGEQITKVQTLGVEWLRDLISKTHAAKSGRDPKKFKEHLATRDFAIGVSLKTNKELAEIYKLSASRISTIRRQHAVDRHIDVHVANKQRVQQRRELRAAGRTQVDDDTVRSPGPEEVLHRVGHSES